MGLERQIEFVATVKVARIRIKARRLCAVRTCSDRNVDACEKCSEMLSKRPVGGEKSVDGDRSEGCGGVGASVDVDGPALRVDGMPPEGLGVP